MVKLIVMNRLLILFCFSAGLLTANNPPTEVKDLAFKRGEVLKYRVHYGLIDAGEAIVEVNEKKETFNNRSVFHVIGHGRSLGAFNFFFKVRDRYDSFIDEETLLPHLFIRRVDEGGFIINQDYTFNHQKNTVKAKRTGTDQGRNIDGKLFEIPPHTQDILSAFYYARSLDLSTYKVGDIISLNTFFDEEIFPLQMKIIGRETVKTKAGKIKCIKVRPIIQQGRVFKNEEDLTLWVSDDKNRIPVMLEAKVLVGSIKMALKEYSGLAHQLALDK
jgi:hypothetical protein